MEHLVTNLGLMLAGAAFLVVLFKMFRQSSIIAFICVGIIAGFFRESFHVPQQMIDVFTEIGIILLLFMAGLEVEFDSLRSRWKVVLGNGLGQIVITTLFGCLIGWVVLDLDGADTIVYFGLCLTLSSTIIVLGYLRSNKEMESIHGQIILGLMVLQDITAVVALVILGSLSGDSTMAYSVALILVKLTVLILFMYAVFKLFLVRIVNHIATSKELLFVGSLGWAVGIAALCESFHFSPEIGAFVAGMTLSFLPQYKLEIQDKVEPIKDFGVILFFISLGYSLEIGGISGELLVPTIVVSFFVVVGTPFIMLFLGFLSRQKSRPAFRIGLIVNQISEFSLILATLCLRNGIFDQNLFTLIALSTLVTIFLSSLGHSFIDNLYGAFRKALSFLDRRSRMTDERTDHFELQGHYVVLGYTQLAEMVSTFLLSEGRRVLLIDIDPKVLLTMKDHDDNLAVMYADVYDPDTWEDAAFADASAIISCVVSGQDAELGILKWMSDRDIAKPFIAATDSPREALELYEAGATYVIQTRELATVASRKLFHEHGLALEGLSDHGQQHWKALLDRSSDLVHR